MLRCNTVFVLGAGFSSELDLPLGSKLTQEIAQILNIKYDINRQVTGAFAAAEAMKIYAHQIADPRLDFNIVRRACVQMSAAMFQAASIDTFINSHNENEIMKFAAKVAIAIAIANAERQSILFKHEGEENQRTLYERTATLGIGKLANLIFGDLTVHSIPEALERVSIVNFNYDRCLERFFPVWVSSYFGISIENSIGLLSNLKIVHPYGVIGQLPWKDENPEKFHEFGSQFEPRNLVWLAKQIRTYSEQLDDSDLKNQIKKMLLQSEQLVFLGSAFHDQNVELLKLGRSSEMRRVFGTAFKISSIDMELIVANIRSALGLRETATLIIRPDWQCTTLLDELHKTLRST